MKKTILSFVMISGIALTFAMAPVANAASCGTVKTSIDYGCKTSSDGVQISPIMSLLLVAINFLAIGAGIAVVAGVVIGAILYITSNGNAKKSEQGVMYIVNSMIGLLLFIFMYALINFLVPGGLFG